MYFLRNDSTVDNKSSSIISFPKHESSTTEKIISKGRGSLERDVSITHSLKRTLLKVSILFLNTASTEAEVL
jgi:hypothetical protein